MRFGVQLPVQAQSTLIAEEWERDAGPTEIERTARACDEAGFDYVGVCDHVGIPAALAGRMSTTWYDTVATLAWLAGRTERVRLLSHVYVVAYRHPLVTSKAFATLDALSGGRAILGVGAGHVPDEFEALGVPFDRRGRITDDSVQQIRAAFRDEWGSGTLGQRPRPVQPGGPPIWVGGSSDAALRRAARLGDGWLPQGPPEGGMERARSILSEHRPSGTLEGFAVGGGLSCYIGEPTFDVPSWTLTGSVDRLVDRIGQLADEGVTHAQVRIPSRSCDELVDQIHRFGSEVVAAVGSD